MRLRCINIVSQEPRRLVEFYEKVFDTQAQEIVPGRWELPAGGATLVFTHTDEPVRAPKDSCGLEFETEDVDGEYSRLQKAGVPLGAPPVTYPWQWRAFGVKDPDGNNVDLVQYVGDNRKDGCGNGG